MAETALSVMTRIKKACGACFAEEIPFDLLVHFEDELAKFQPFQTVHLGWIRSQGGGQTGKRVSSQWVWRQFEAGLAPQEVLKLAEEQVTQNRYDILEVYPIYGLKVAKRFDLSPDTYICPNSDLPKSSCYSMAFLTPTYALLPNLRHEASALVFRIPIDPAIVPSKVDRTPDLCVRERLKLSIKIRLALALMTDGPIEMPSQYTDMAIDSLVGGTGGHFTCGGQPVGNKVSFMRDISALPILADSIAAMASEAMMLSIDRLLTSRLRTRLEDRILDLGMAAEIALMHDPSGGGGGKGEIIAKMSSRGAWLLGRDGADRVTILKELKSLYSARSRVAHSGRADAKLKEVVPSFDSLVVRILRELLRRGQFPDWNGLTLGAL